MSDLSAERVKALVGSLVLLDGRNIYDPQRLRDLGFTYWGMGLGYEQRSQARIIERR